MPYSREVRLGVVLYGGVSLAVYENGVAQELYRAVRGEGVYGLLKELIQSDIVVDTISGTSAGGVNGVMLGYALANDLDFTSVASLWKDKADIERLLRTPNDPDPSSLLNSEGYYQPQLEQALRHMPACQPGEKASAVTELDLFITGTDVAGDVYTVYDDRGHAIDVKNHRAVFKLQFRRGRTPGKNDFHPDGVPQLAKLARLTSCFPAAFAPVNVGPDTDARLFRWGKLKRESFYLDGGILDNKPFSYAVETIADRTADRDVDRVLLYVEPDPEKFARARGSASDLCAPSAAESAVDALTTIPGYESIAGDLASIARHNDLVGRVNRILRSFGAAPDATPESLAQVTVADDRGLAAYSAYYGARLMELRNRAVEGILNDAGGRRYMSTPRERRAAEILVESFGYWEGEGGDTLRSYDIYFRQRRLDHLARMIRKSLYDNGVIAPEARKNYERFLRDLNHFAKVNQIIRWAMEAWVDRQPIEWISLDARFRDDEGNAVDPSPAALAEIAAQKWGEVASGLSALLSADGITVPVRDDKADRGRFYVALERRLAQPYPNPSGNLMERMDFELAEAISNFSSALPQNIVLREFCRFLDVDRELFPLVYWAEFKSLDLIRIVRMSPVDAQRGLSNRAIENKVCGRTLGAFGGFFKRPWRANDIVFGRLDAVGQIIETLLTLERMKQLWPDPKFQPNVDIAGPDTLAAIFQHSKAAVTSGLAKKLLRIGQLSERELESVINTLVRCAHEEIVSQEWYGVLEAAVAQESEWAQHRKQVQVSDDPAFDSRRLVWKAAKITPDRTLLALASKAIQRSEMPDFAEVIIAGQPFLEEIPKPVLLQIASLAAIRALRSIAASVPNAALRQSVERSRACRFLVNCVLPSLYNWARFQREAPEWRVTLNTVLITASIIVFIAGVFLVPMTYLHVQAPALILAVMLLVPLVVLSVWLWIFRR